tara:strand:+ start:695 stop:946 length:252 start_codon:yes stop_codon:yes gene_type:complete
MSVKDIVETWDIEEQLIDDLLIQLRNLGTGFDCDLCKHLNDDNITCKAFPEGIPNDIHTSVIDHRNPFPGDNGVIFEPIKAED